MNLSVITDTILQSGAETLVGFELPVKKDISPYDTHKELVGSALKLRDYTVLCGIGQYSLEKGPALLVAKFGTRFRSSLAREYEENRMMGSFATPVDEGRAYFIGRDSMGGLRLNFPARLYSSFFVVSVLPLNEPPIRHNLGLIVSEIDELADREYGEKSEMFNLKKGQRIEEIKIKSVDQGYLFFFAKNGELSFTSFDKVERYNPQNLKSFGHLQMVGGDLGNWIQWLLDDGTGLRLLNLGRGKGILRNILNN